MHFDIISNGMGAPSMYMLILAAEGKIPVTLSITADTGSELDRVINTGERITAPEYHRQIIEPYANSHSIEAVFIRAQDKDGNELPAIIDLLRQGNTAGTPFFGSNNGRNPQYCTGKWKVRAVRQELRRRGATTARVALGLTLSETERMKVSDVKWCENWWPLIDLNLYRVTIQEEMDNRSIPYLLSSECDHCQHKNWARWQRTSQDTIDELAEIEELFPGLYFTDKRIPLKEAIEKMDPHTSGMFGCDSGGYCFT